ncbi:unnamed protein product [Closterium sp. NIES-64]|nr:unnamed protein product [Closterium sp. NIES-64]
MGFTQLIFKIQAAGQQAGKCAAAKRALSASSTPPPRRGSMKTTLKSSGPCDSTLPWIARLSEHTLSPVGFEVWMGPLDAPTPPRLHSTPSSLRLYSPTQPPFSSHHPLPPVPLLFLHPHPMFSRPPPTLCVAAADWLSRQVDVAHLADTFVEACAASGATQFFFLPSPSPLLPPILCLCSSFFATPLLSFPPTFFPSLTISKLDLQAPKQQQGREWRWKGAMWRAV